MSPRKFRPSTLAGTLIGALLSTAPLQVRAQEVAPDAGTLKARALEEIIVSGERRRENLQEVPASISAFSADELANRGITSFNALQYAVPSLFSGDGGLARITLRGVGSEIVGPGVDPGFAVYFNGVYSARETTGLFSYFDIQQVEVLRGPQGMLGGRSSTGGSVNVTTARPGPDFAAEADLEYGRFDSVLLRGYVNVPLLDDKLSSRIAFLRQTQEGTMEIDGPGNHQRLNDVDTTSVRASLRWEPTSDLTFDLIGSYLYLDNNGSGIKFSGPYTTPPAPFLGMGFGYGLDYESKAPPLFRPPEPSEPAEANPADPYRGTANEPQHQRATVWTASLIGEWQRDDWRLVSTSGYQQTWYDIHRDQDTSSLAIQTLDLHDESLQVSQDFVANSDWDGPFDWTLGANYQWDKSPRTQIVIPNAQDTAFSRRLFLAPFFPGVAYLVDGCGPIDISNCPPVKPPNVTRDDFVDAKASNQNHVAGVFGNLAWKQWPWEPLNERLTLSAGLRFSYTFRKWRDDSLVQSFVFPVTPLPSGTSVTPASGLQVLQRGTHDSRSWKAVTWKVGLDYALTEEQLLWASVGTGERAGGFNFVQVEPFAEERILAVETGYKSQFLENRLRFNLTAFWYDWDDPQISQRVDSINVTTNAPNATSYGIEAELEWLATDALLVNATFGWLESYYDEHLLSADSTRPEYPEATCGTLADPCLPIPEAVVDLHDNRMPRSPPFTASFGAQYSFDLGRYGSLTPRVDFYYRDWITFRQFDNELDEQPAYTRTDVRLTWLSESQKVWLAFWARNLEDEAAKTNQEIQNDVYRVHYYDMPFRAGFQAGFQY